MLFLGVLIGVFVAVVGVMLLVATKEKRIALPLMVGGAVLTAAVMSMMIMNGARAVVF